MCVLGLLFPIGIDLVAARHKVWDQIEGKGVVVKCRPHSWAKQRDHRCCPAAAALHDLPDACISIILVFWRQDFCLYFHQLRMLEVQNPLRGEGRYIKEYFVL